MPAPLPYGGETLVNTTTTGDQKVPQVAALANGDYVVVWQDTSGAPPDSSLDAVRAKIFHADGTPLGSEFVLSEFPFAIQQDPVVTALPDGRFVAVWESFNHALQDQSGTHVSARIFNPDGTPSTGEFQVNTHTDFWQTKPAIATLDTGGFVITWMHDFVGGNQNYDIFARVYDASGQPIAAQDQGVDISPVIERAPVVTGLPGGKFVIAWEDTGDANQTDGSGSHIRALIYTGNFQPLNGPSFTVNSTTVNDQSDPAITTLSNGNFVVTWTHAFSASDDDVRGRVFNGNGVAQSNDFGIDTSGNGVRETQSAITALPNGEYFAVWRDTGAAGAGQSDGSGSHIRGAIMSGNGSAVSGQFIINTTANGDQGEPTVAALADGRVVVSWTDFGMNGGDTSGQAVRSQILDPRSGPVTLSGSGGNDEWVGTAFADTLNGGAGADILDGAGGDDTLIGGAAPAGSPNQLRGGTGSDTASYVGTAGTVYADLGALSGYVGGVLVDKMSSIENLAGGTGTNTLVGDGSANVLTGGAGIDYLYGQGGDDTLIGGAAPAGSTNQLWGGTGSDTALYAGVAGTVYADIGALVVYVGGVLVDQLNSIENVTGGSGTNTLVGDGGANVLTGGAGIDYLYGQAGDDTLIGGAAPAGSTNQLWGGAGNDTASYAGTAGSVHADVAALAGYVNGVLVDQMNAIENLTGGSGSDVLVGDGGANVLSGGAGMDNLYGQGGDDTLIGGLATPGGTNQLWGGTGSDTASYAGTTGIVFADIGAQTGYVGGVLVDQMNSIENLSGGSNADTLVGDGGANVLAGAGGGDALWGKGGTNRFVYGAWADSNLVGGYDTIGDFQLGIDKIDLSAFASNAGHLVILTNGTSNSVYLEVTAGSFNPNTDLALNVTATTTGGLHASDFVF